MNRKDEEQMKGTILKWALLVLLAAYTVGMAVWANVRAADDVCSGIDIHITGISKADPVTEKGVLAELGKYPERIVGTPLRMLNTLKIENYLRSLAAFENVECALSSQGKLVVKITPMIPEIRVFDGPASYYVNKDGKRIRSNAEFYSDVPVVSGHFTRGFPATYVLPVTRFIQQDSLLSRLTGMIVAKDRDNILLVPVVTGHIINLGDTSDLPLKRRAILTAYKTILPARGWEKYDTISVKFKNLIVATRRDKTPLHPLPVVEEESDPEEGNIPTDAAPPEKKQADD